MKNLLFLCTGNSCRSQIAEGFVRELFPKKFTVFSAGINPKGLHHLAVKVMKETGIDISSHQSKGLLDIPVDEIDIVITLCGDANERCPSFNKNVKKIHWDIEDPAESDIAVFRRVRDEIKRRINEYIHLDENS